MVGVGIVCVHGAFRDPEDLFMDDQDTAGSTGLFSFIGGPSVGSNVIPLVWLIDGFMTFEGMNDRRLGFWFLGCD